jgi:hypothetical protein
MSDEESMIEKTWNKIWPPVGFGFIGAGGGVGLFLAGIDKGIVNPPNDFASFFFELLGSAAAGVIVGLVVMVIGAWIVEGINQLGQEGMSCCFSNDSGISPLKN